MKGDWRNNINENHPKNITKEQEELFYQNIANYCLHFDLDSALRKEV